MFALGLRAEQSNRADGHIWQDLQALDEGIMGIGPKRIELVESDLDPVAQLDIGPVAGEILGVARSELDRVPVPRKAMRDGKTDLGSAAEDQDWPFRQSSSLSD